MNDAFLTDANVPSPDNHSHQWDSLHSEAYVSRKCMAGLGLRALKRSLSKNISLRSLGVMVGTCLHPSSLELLLSKQQFPSFVYAMHKAHASVMLVAGQFSI